MDQGNEYPPEPGLKKKHPREKVAEWLIFFALVVLAWVLFGRYLAGNPQSEKVGQRTLPEVEDAYRVAQKAVKQYVETTFKAPGTARYSEDWSYSRPSDSVFIIQGWVDAENSFGAMIRKHYVVRLTYVGTDPDDSSSWRLDELTFL